MKKKMIRLALTCATLTSVALLFSACEIDSAETSSRNVPINIAGFYSHPSGGKLVANNTGASINTMDLRQSGDELEGVDSSGNIFKGTIGQVDGTIASINLSGMTTAGQEGTISGTIEVSSTTDTATDNATMRGTWIEPSLTSTVYGQATVPENTNPDPGGTNGTSGVDLQLSSGSSTINTSGSDRTRTFTVVNGNPSYSISLDDATLGSLSTSSVGSSGGTFTYTATSGEEGNQTIRATDQDGDTDTETIVQNNG